MINLTIEDNFGYSLDARPSALQKWLAAGQTDIMDFPDITKTENKVKNYYTVNGGPTTFRFKAYDGTSYEGCGIEPDISIPLNTTADNRFTAAVNWVANGVKSY